MSTLDTITANYPLCFDRLAEVVKEWSRLNYDINKFGRPNWRKLAEAVASFDKRLFYSLAYEHKIKEDEKTSVQACNDKGMDIQACTDEGMSIQASNDEGTSIQPSNDEGMSIQASNDEGTSIQAPIFNVKQNGAIDAPGAKVKSKHVFF